GDAVGERYCFLPHDYSPSPDRSREDNLSDQALTAEEVGKALARCVAQRRLLVLDTCSSGAAVDALLKIWGSRPKGGPDFQKAVERLNRSEGCHVLAAAPLGKEAQEAAELRSGLLTYALLAGLHAAEGGPLKGQGAAVNPSDQVIDVQDLMSYVTREADNLM